MTGRPEPRNIGSGTKHGQQFERLRAGWLSQFPDTTADAYARDLTQFTSWADTDKPLAASRAQIQEWLNHLRERGLAPPTIRRKASALSSFYEYAAQEDAISVNPARHTRRPKGGDGQRLGLDIEEARAVVQQARDHSKLAYAIVGLLMVTGLRVSEACSADVDDLDTDSGTPVLQITRKGGHTARVPLAPQVVAALEDLIGDRTEGPLLTGPRGGRVTRQTASRLVAELGTQAGIRSELSAHICRHTAATSMVRSGIPLEKVQAVMGHSSIQTTVRYLRALRSLDATPTTQLADELMSLTPKQRQDDSSNNDDDGEER